MGPAPAVCVAAEEWGWRHRNALFFIKQWVETEVVNRNAFPPT